ncbi:Na+/H+ antiporter NhaC family protein [Ornithinimicrobium faecis]|uniref:Uncharacterized protein n=1 Tax=Ornithinimicrobium faecis TaxID=2934158 RepID=A0ABY4YR68_9MICO|nr:MULTISPECIES: Na+/H+ antiporter NhaC family protein [unclassified Ornithinimicrobium]USQ78657.1 hypothetical protein NF556_13595 [Ornithinimicrobium sp. HY1793]
MTDTTSEASVTGLDRKAKVGWSLAGAAVVVALCVAIFDQGALGLWGLLPIVVYALLALLELNILLSTFIAMVTAMILARLSLLDIGTALADSMGSFITVVGIIILLGAGVGAIANATGAAQALVSSVMKVAGTESTTRTQLGIVLAAILIVGSLGTLAGGNSIIAPLVIPLAAAASLSRPATAVTLHTAGAAGLVLGPFTPPVVTIMGAADISYSEYLFGAGLPLAAVFVIVGFVMTRVLNARTRDETYGEEDLADLTSPADQPAHARTAAAAFIGTILVMTVIGIVIQAGYVYAIVVMLTTALTTSIAGRLDPSHAVTTFCRGAGTLLWLFFMFWFFDVILVIVENSGAYQVLLDAVAPAMQDAGPWPFLMLTLLVGWIGIAGAAVAQVVLIDKLFAPLAASLGIPPIAWAAALLGGSQIDWFGPFPNGDMVGQMGIARSQNLKAMLIAGWTVMTVSVFVLAALFWILL